MRSPVLVSILLLTAVSFISRAQEEPQPQPDPFGAYLQIQTGERGGYSNGNQTEAMFFVPITQDNTSSILFVDLRTVLSDDAGQNLSLGLGYRKIVNEKFILGGNAAVDRRQSSSGESYTQGQVGIEVMMNRLDISANFYKPLSSSENELFYAEGYTARLDGNRAFIDGTTLGLYEQALDGWDVHAAYNFASIGDTNFFAKGSYYEYDGGDYAGEDISDYTLGLQARRGTQFRTHSFEFSAEAGVRVENDRDPEPYAGVFGRFYFGRRGSSSTSDGGTHDLKAKLFEPIKRSTAIATATQERRGSYTVPATITVGEITYDEITAQIDNSALLFDTVSNAGDNTLVVLDGQRGTFILNDLLQVGDSQSLVGGSTPVLVTGPQGQQAVLILPGQNAVVASHEGDGLSLTDSSQLVNVTELKLTGPVENTLIINSSIEEGHVLTDGRWSVFSEITGWTADLDASDAPIEVQNGTTTEASDGTHYIELDSHRRKPYTESNSHVYQDIPTEDGQAYRLSFDYAVARSPRGINDANYQDSNTVEVYWEGQKIAELNEFRQDWTTTEILVTGNAGGASRLEFRAAGREDTYGGFIDNVRLQQVNQP